MCALAIFKRRTGRTHFEKKVRVPGKRGREAAIRHGEILRQRREERRKELLKQNAG